MSDASISITQQIANESTQGTLNLVDAPTLPAIPAPQATIDALMKTVTAIKAILDAREGNGKTSVLDQNLTLRDLMNEGALGIQIGQNLFSGTGVSALDMGTGYQNPLPVLVVPPTPTALTAQGAFKNVVLDWALFAYANAAYVEVWRAGTNALGAAVLLGTSTANLYTDANVVTGTTYYYWVRAIAIGGAAGPFNAVGGTSGALLTVAGTDLSALAVSADKLSQGTYPNINLVPNPGAEDGTVCWSELSVFNNAHAVFSVDTAQKTGGTQSFKLTKALTSDGDGVASTAFPVIPGETYSVKLRMLGSAATGAGFNIIMEEKTAKPAGLFVDNGGADAADSSVTLVGNAAFPNVWTSYEFSYTATAGRFWASLAVSNWVGGPLGMWFDDVSVGRQITASFLAANSIAVGTAAIQNGALVNAMIANLAVDNAKIANATITGGKIAVATITAGNVVAGTLTANEIAANTIRASNLILTGAGAALNADPQFTDSTLASFPAANGTPSRVSVSGGPAGLFALRLTSSASAISSARTATVAAVGGKTYRVSVWIKGDATGGNGFVRLYISDSAGTLLQFSLGLEGVTFPSGVWTHYTGTIAAAATAATMQAEVIADFPGTGSGVTDIQDFRIEEAVPASLIVAGTITTDRLIANAATSAAITGGTFASAVPFTLVAVINVGATSVVTLTSTGSPVLFTGLMAISITTSTAPFRCDITINHTLNGSVIAGFSYTTSHLMEAQGTGRFLQVVLPLCVRQPVGAGSNAWGISATITFMDNTGSGISSTGTYTIAGTGTAQENKV